MAAEIPNHHPRPTPVRDDCWSEAATFTLIEAWGQRFLDLNRGNLRQNHWQEVADAVNSRHAHNNPKAFRTDVQCKNRIDTLKKKFKSEKARVSESLGTYRSLWPFFPALDPLIGSSAFNRSHPSASASASPPMAVPLPSFRRSTPPVVAASVVAPLKRRISPAVATPFTADYSFRRNYSAAAAAAAADETDEEEEEEDEEAAEEVKVEAKGSGGGEGLRKLAKAIEMFGEVYARVEAEKQRQTVELEKQRMEFAKELECQRMQMLVEMQVQLQKVKRAKRSNSNEYC